MRPLEDRSDGHGELLAASLAFEDARPRRLALKAGNGRVAAMDTRWTARPAKRLKVGAGLIFGQLGDVREVHVINGSTFNGTFKI
jgi:hypothetical protein